MAADSAALRWAAQLLLSPSPRAARLPGDKIILPATALEQLLSASATAQAAASGPAPSYDPFNPRHYDSYQTDLRERQQNLPQPLTFRLVNPENGRVVYAGIREFSANDDEIEISPFISTALGLETTQQADLADGPGLGNGTGLGTKITAHFQQLPKGLYVKLRPLEAGYDVDDWKALLEQHLRTNFTTLTKGEVLEVPGQSDTGQASGVFKFLVDEFKPAGDAICVVDTDLEVDIEALNEEQARETVKKVASKFQAQNGSGGGTPIGGDLDIFKSVSGQVMPGEYVDYQLPSWPREQVIEIEATPDTPEDDLDLLVIPFSTRHRVRPRANHYVFANWEDGPSKRIRISPTNVEMEGAEALYISVYGFEPPDGTDDIAKPRSYTISVRAVADGGMQVDDGPEIDEQSPNPGDVRCKNCLQWVPSRTLMLHENFCLRNNVLCSHGCGQVFQKRSEAFAQHWHCPHDTFHGNSSLTLSKHNILYHPSSPLSCTRCTTTRTFTSIPLLAQHHTTTCPARLILCRFCHLAVPQEGDPDVPNPEAILSNLTPHELADGSRTTECHLCAAIVRMRDMQTHMAHHDLSRKSRPRPRVCRNVNCGNTLDGTLRTGSTRAGKDAGNDVGLCGECFGPLYVSLYDPEGKALKRRIERRYLSQLMQGCGRTWCRNEFCRSGREALDLAENGTTAKTALPMVKPVLDGIANGRALHFCVHEGAQRRRQRAEVLEAELKDRLGVKSYDLAWCVAACEAEDGKLDKAREWLENWAPRREEEKL